MYIFFNDHRFYIIYRPMSIRIVSTKLKVLTIIGCLVMGLFWASMPLIGWSHYSLEGAETSCSVEWKERSLNVISYNVTIFAVVYLVPLICILVTNIKLISMVSSRSFSILVFLIDISNLMRFLSLMGFIFYRLKSVFV